MNKILQCWLSIHWKTRLISLTILVISITMSTITFVLLIHIQNELINTNLRFFRDFSSVVSYHVASLMYNNSQAELKDFLEKIYLTTSSIDYLRLFDSEGSLVFSFPVDSFLFNYMLDLHANAFNFGHYTFFLNIPSLNHTISVKQSLTHCIIPLLVENEVFGFLQLGLNFNNGVIYITNLIQTLSILVFVSVWLMFILGASFNIFITIDPIRELLIGMQNIANGYFGQRINLLFRGEIGSLIVSFNEMSERLQFYEKKNIMQLTSEKAKLEALVSTIADGAILLDTELRILCVNNIVVKVFQWFNKDLIGTIIFQHLPIHVNEALLPILNGMIQSNCFDNKNIQSQELIIDLHYESLKTFRFLFSTILSHNRQCFNGVVIIIQDITRENQLNEAKNRFISNVSHELRTPLCNIGSFLETLIDYDYKLTLKQKSQFLDIAYAETQRLNSLVNDILDLSRLESECSYVLKPIILTNTISYIVQASQIVALNQHVQIIVEIHSNIKRILAHQSSLCQVLSNLISNSLKFTHKQGRIVIRVYPLLIKKQNVRFYNTVPEIVRLEVIDEGIGIHKIFQKQIFDRFMRIENNIHTLKGTGLGLSIVKNIIKKHNSTISVYSEVNIGTSFWFDLFIVQ